MGCVNCVIPLRQVGGCLQSVYSVSYLWEVDGCLHGLCELRHSL
jgi:hypothetical protein